MSTLTSNSTLAEVRAAYDDNASYAEDRSPAKARAFVTACRILINRLPEESSKADERIRMTETIRQLRIEIKEARNWLSVNGTSVDNRAESRQFGFENYR